MAKKEKTYLETIMSDFKKGEKIVKDAVSKLESRVQSRDSRIAYLEKELQDQKDYYEFKFLQIFGVNFENYLIGYGFEKHVVRWMNQYFSQYELKIWQGDKCVQPYIEGDKISASWNTYPDLIYVNEVKKKVIALECKYRNDGWLELERRQYENYKKFETQIRSFMGVDASVFIIGGSRGLNSDSPDYMYCIPLDFFADKDIVDFREIPEYKVYERGLSNVIKDNIPF